MGLYARVLRFIDGSDADSFEDLALAIFRFQYETVAAYRGVCERRGIPCDSISDWRQIPPVPALAFKHADLCAGTAERVFLTTGTTQGAEGRGRHAMPCLELYRHSAIAGMRQFLFPDLAKIRIASLVHRAGDRPESSLAQMVEWAFETFGTHDGDYFIDGSTIDFDGLDAMLRRSEDDRQPVAILTTTGALIRWLDECRARGRSYRLTHGSRLMDTGGAKGAPRPMSRNGLLRAVWEALAIPGYFVVNEYGMTEMSGQFYDSVVRDRFAGRFGKRVKAGPRWVRTRVLDPLSLTEVAAGERGVLCHTDLANAGSALTVLTEDLGRLVDGGFEIEGRVAGAEARGCSLALADFVAANSALG